MRGGVILDLALGSYAALLRCGDKGLGGDVNPQLVEWTASVLLLPALDIRLGVEQPLLLAGEDWRDCPSTGHQLNCPMHPAAPAMLFYTAAGAQWQRGSTASADTLGWQERVCCSSKRRRTIHDRSLLRAGLPGLRCACRLRILLVTRRQRRSGL